MVLLGRTANGGNIEDPTWTKIRPGNQPAKVKKRITPMAVTGPSSTIKSSATQGQKKEQQLMDELVHRIVSDPMYGTTVEGFQAGERLLPETWGQKDHSADYKRALELADRQVEQTKRQDRRLEDIISKYEGAAKKGVTPTAAPKRKRGKKCDISGYSKLKKADLISSLQSVGVETDRKMTVRALRALARKHCGYKTVQRKSTGGGGRGGRFRG